MIIGHGSVSWALVLLLKILNDPSKDEYHIKYGELKKLYSKDYHMQHNISIANRAAAIILHKNSLLAMHRKKNGKTYYTFPGGTVEQNESEANAALREVSEETCITAQNPKLLYKLIINNFQNSSHAIGIKNEFFFLCDYISGDVQIHEDAPEYGINDEDNYYQPTWIPIKEIKNMCLFPLEIRDLLLNDLESTFKSEPQIVEADYKNLR